jgi:hypothetical protein
MLPSGHIVEPGHSLIDNRIKHVKMSTGDTMKSRFTLIYFLGTS